MDKFRFENYKLIGTQKQEDFDVSDTNWQPKTVDKLPLGTLVTEPTGYLWTHGSACISAATHSPEGLRYNADWLVFRRDDDHINTDRYFVSLSLDGVGTVLMHQKDKNPYHAVNLGDPITEELLMEKRRLLERILEESDDESEESSE